MYKHAKAAKLLTDSESKRSMKLRLKVRKLLERLGYPKMLDINKNEKGLNSHISNAKNTLILSGVSPRTVDLLLPLLFRYDDVLHAYRVWCEISKRRDESKILCATRTKQKRILKSHKLSEPQLVHASSKNPKLETALSVAFKKAKTTSA